MKGQATIIPPRPLTRRDSHRRLRGESYFVATLWPVIQLCECRRWIPKSCKPPDKLLISSAENVNISECCKETEFYKTTL